MLNLRRPLTDRSPQWRDVKIACNMLQDHLDYCGYKYVWYQLNRFGAVCEIKRDKSRYAIRMHSIISWEVWQLDEEDHNETLLEISSFDDVLKLISSDTKQFN